MASTEDEVLAADLLWESMKLSPTLSTEAPNFRNVWRTRLYPWLVNKQTKAIWQHRNPEPWLTITNSARGLSGDAFARSSRRYEGVIGGKLTEMEYQDLISGKVRLPLIMLGGYPRSGTTSMQSLIRHCWPSHIPERPSNFPRFSLWEYPKHDPELMRSLSLMARQKVIVVHAFRNFEDAAASLAVGRGSLEAVHLNLEIENWKKWAELALHPRVVTVPFELVSSTAPHVMVNLLEKHLELPVENNIDQKLSYRQLMQATGKGDSESSHQSNVPSVGRADLLKIFREKIYSLISEDDRSELIDVHARVLQSSMDAFGTEDPE